MSERRKKHFESMPAPRRRGATLIEVLAGLALLASVLAALLVAKGNLARQWEMSRRRCEATQAADALLMRWWQEPELFPQSGDGEAPGGWRWHLGAVSNPEAERLGGRVMRLELFESVPPSTAHKSALASVDLVIPLQPAESVKGGEVKNNAAR